MNMNGTVRKEREAAMDIIQRAYDLASPTDEMVTGNYAEDFAGEVTWSRILELDVPEYPGVRGLGYMDFKDCTNVRVLWKSGDSFYPEMMFYDVSKCIAEQIQRIRAGRVQGTRQAQNVKRYNAYRRAQALHGKGKKV